MQTDIKVYRNDENDTKVKAFVSLTIDNALAIKGIKVMEGKNGLFVSMPQRKDANAPSGYRDLVFPITAEFREELFTNILKAYKDANEE